MAMGTRKQLERQEGFWIAIADPTTYSAISSQLDSVINRATKLKQEVAAASAKPAALAAEK